LRARTVLINGVSKTYAMTGWRIGYAAGPADIIAAMDMLQSQSTSNASSVSQAAALAALRGDQSFVPVWSDTYRQRVERALQLVNAIPGLSCRTPGGAFYLFVNCGGLIGRQTAEGKTLQSDIDVTLYLLETAGVAMVAGSGFGLSPYFRISIATSMELIEEGCRRIAQAVNKLSV
jgi:aspartate aminotransferase